MFEIAKHYFEKGNIENSSMLQLTSDITSKLSKKKKQVAEKQQSKIMCGFNQPDDNAIPPNGRNKFITFNFFHFMCR